MPVFKRLAALILYAVMLLSGPARGAEIETPGVSAAAWVVYDPWREAVLWGENIHQRRPMASTTKIMTAALALELYNLETEVTIRPQWCGVEGSSMYLRAGETLTIADLLHGLMLMSGNDAALALAALHSGGADGFVILMNARAQELGLENTAFTNPGGLNAEGHFSSAYDMAVMAAWAMENPDFAAIVGSKTTTSAGRYMKNHNRLLSSLEGCSGVKTGYTSAAGRCLVSACTRLGRTFIVVTLDGSNDWRDHSALHEAAFSGLALRRITKAGTVGTAHLAEGGSVELSVTQSVNAVLSDREVSALRLELRGPRIWYGEAQKEALWGTLALVLEGKTIGEIEVVFAENSGSSQAKHGLFAKLRRLLFGIFEGKACKNDYKKSSPPREFALVGRLKSTLNKGV